MELEVDLDTVLLKISGIREELLDELEVAIDDCFDEELLVMLDIGS